MSTPKGKRLEVKDFELYKCICSAFDLLHKGCRCGAYAQAVADRDAAQRVADYEAAEEKRAMQEFFNGKMTPPITFKPLCADCGHAPHPKGGSGCADPNCLCGSVKP